MRGEIRFDPLGRTIYSCDASLYQITPVGVAIPRDADEVVRVVNAARRNKTPIVPRGAGTGIAGGAVGAGLQVDFSKYLTHISDLDVENRTVRVQPGVVLDDLNEFLRPHGLHFPPDVATASRATIGGMIGNNACGAHSVMYGRTVDYIAELTVALADGSVQTWTHFPYDELPPLNGMKEQIPWARPPRLAARRQAQRAGWDAHAEQTLPEAMQKALLQVRAEYRDEVIERYPRVLRRNGGYALDRFCMSSALNPATLICGSEGTLALVLEAQLRLAPRPRHSALLVAQFDSVFNAVGLAPKALQHTPAAVELMDHLILEAGAPQIPPALRGQLLTGIPRAVLVTELYDEDRTRLASRMELLQKDFVAAGVRILHPVFPPDAQAALWEMRKRGFGLLMSRPGPRQPHEFIEDAAVDPRRLREYLEALSTVLAEEGVTDVGYYAHASVGVIHVRPVLNLHQNDDVERLARIARRTSELVLRFGGAFTGEHGDGLVRSWSLEHMYGPRIVEAFRRVKHAFDPEGVFNPNKIVDPLPITANLRYRGVRVSDSHAEQGRDREGAVSPDVAEPLNHSFETHLDFSHWGAADEHGMLGLARMCSGVGQCRQKLVGTMCPSYMATLDEQHTTRARAVALRQALEGGGLLNGLADPALRDVMDLCISCKACKHECPTGVDMARLKAEWLAFLNQTQGTPRSARFQAAAPRLARRASLVPGMMNFVLRHPVVRALLESRYGLDRRIPPPRLAQRTFRKWWKRHRAPAGERPAVAYFVDTWTNFYWPEAGIAAVRLLEAAGYEVIVPQTVCCGRPAISKGMLNEARRLAERNIATLAEFAQHDIPIVGSEPSCILTFIDEAPQLLRTAEAQQVARVTKTVEQFLAKLVSEDATMLPFARLDDPPIAVGQGTPAQNPRHGAHVRRHAEATGAMPTKGRHGDVTAAMTGGQHASPSARLLYHAHCHQKALIGTAAVRSLLGAVPHLRTTEINSGCCGMAGGFGHEKDHYDVARAIGEQRLFPAVRARGEAEIIVSGFSCREQIEHHCKVRPRHVLEVLADALNQSPPG